MNAPFRGMPVPGVSHLLRDDPAAGVFELDRAAFIDESVFEAEMRGIFEATWVFVGLESQDPQSARFHHRVHRPPSRPADARCGGGNRLFPEHMPASRHDRLPVQEGHAQAARLSLSRLVLRQRRPQRRRDGARGRAISAVVRRGRPRSRAGRETRRLSWLFVRQSRPRCRAARCASRRRQGLSRSRRRSKRQRRGRDGSGRGRLHVRRQLEAAVREWARLLSFRDHTQRLRRYPEATAARWRGHGLPAGTRRRRPGQFQLRAWSRRQLVDQTIAIVRPADPVRSAAFRPRARACRGRCVRNGCCGSAI